MAPSQHSAETSFDAFIQSNRQKKKNEALAQELLGRTRKAKPPQLGVQLNASKGSLASRITKPGPRSASLASITKSDPRASLKRSQSSAIFERGSARDALLSYASEHETRSTRKGFSIKGKAGPYVVVGSNFAPGTTSADIQAAMEPVGGEMMSCMIVSATPTVIAEMVFDIKNGADAVIARFNNQMADGRLLHLYHKNGPPATKALPSALGANEATTTPPTGSTNPTLSQQPKENGWGSNAKNGRNAEPEIQDGTYGFVGSRNENVDVDMDQQLDSRYDHRRRYDSGGRSSRRDYDYYSSERGRYRDVGRRPQNDLRPFDKQAQRSDRGLYSDSYSQSNRGNGYR